MTGVKVDVLSDRLIAVVADRSVDDVDRVEDIAVARLRRLVADADRLMFEPASGGGSMGGRHPRPSGAGSGAQAAAGAVVRPPERVALASPEGRRLVERASAAQELKSLRSEDDADLAGRLEDVLGHVGLAGLAVDARWGSLVPRHGPGILAVFQPAYGRRRATIIVESGMLVRGGWSDGGVTIDPTQPCGFKRVIDDVLIHEIGHAIARLRTGDEDADHGQAFGAAVAELCERSAGWLPSPIAPLWCAWPAAQRPDGHYGLAAPAMSSTQRRHLQRPLEEEQS